MKKFFSITVCLVLLAAACLSLASCGFAKNTNSNPIDYGKKYVLDGASDANYACYVFNRDNTGYMERHYEHVSTVDPEYNYTLSGRVEFVWQEASNGAVYLFETDTYYNEDHTEGNKIALIDDPIYFSEHFFTYTYSNQYGGTTVNYIKEGSNLEKLLED